MPLGGLCRGLPGLTQGETQTPPAGRTHGDIIPQVQEISNHETVALCSLSLYTGTTIGIVFDLLSFARQNRVMAQSTHVNELVRGVVSEEEQKDAYASVRIVQELDLALPIIQADPDQLRQMRVNLMSDAADAMAPQGGKLTLHTRRIVKMHRGDIRVQSEPGKGATFAVVLPTMLPNAERVLA